VMKYTNLRNRGSLLIVLLLLVGLMALVRWSYQGMSEKGASKAFKRYVLDPIPKSVTNIKVDQPKNFQGYRYTFRFNINRSDLDLLIHSKPFVRVWSVEYKNGDLRWSWDRPDGKYWTTRPCYDHTKEPSWFRLEQWDAYEAYVFTKVGNLLNMETLVKQADGPTNVKILLYNENESEVLCRKA
jgi:hypothetical protein